MSACGAACGYCGRCEEGPPRDAVCVDCGEAFWTEHDSTGSLCDRCCEVRDATSQKARMVKMDRPAVPKVVERPGKDWAGGPHACCVDYAQVVACDGVTTLLRCGVCASLFTQPCPDAAFAAMAGGA